MNYRHYTYCAICLKPLTEAEKKTTAKFDLNSTCTEHKAFKNEFNLTSLRFQLGLPQDEVQLLALQKK